MLTSIDSICCILLITEIKATRFKSVVEKAFYSGYHLWPGEIGCGLVPRLNAVWPLALQVTSQYCRDLWSFLWDKNLEIRLGGKEFSADSQLAESSRRGYVDSVPLVLRILVDKSIDLQTNLLGTTSANLWKLGNSFLESLKFLFSLLP